MLPNHRLLARAFHRMPPSPFSRMPRFSPLKITTTTTVGLSRRLSNTPIFRGFENQEGWKGRQADEHILNEKDKHNVQHDASHEGKQERAAGNGSRATSEKSGGSNDTARKEFPEAPDTIGMQDERGGPNKPGIDGNN